MTHDEIRSPVASLLLATAPTLRTNRAAVDVASSPGRSPLENPEGMLAKATVASGPKGEYKIDVQASTQFAYDYTFMDDDSDMGVFNLENSYLADRFRDYGRCVVIIDARVYDIYGDDMQAYFKHHGLGLEVFPLGIDEQQKSMRTVEEVLVYFADVGLMRREKPLLVGGGLITDIVGTACSLYRRSTSYLRLPSTLIGMVDAAIAIKVGGNLAEKHKNRIGAFHPHDGVIMDFHLLKTLSEAHIRNGLAELLKISIVEEPEVFELLEKHGEDLLKYKMGYAEDAPRGLREIGRKVARKSVLRMLQLECPNLLEHDQRRAIAYGHTWSPVYELTPKPYPMHHGHAISVDMAFSATWAAKEGWISESLRDRIHDSFRRVGLSLYHPSFTVENLHYGTTTILQRRDGDLYAAIPDGEIGKCRFINTPDFENRAALDASLEAGLKAHIELVNAKYAGGVGKECYITEGFDSKGTGGSSSKLELGTWSERMEEMLDGVQASQSYESVVKRVDEIKQWWDSTHNFLEQNSNFLRGAVLKILTETRKGNVFPEGMGVDWALDVQSAQTLDFLAGVQSKTGKIAWDLGTLTGVSAAVLSQHMQVTTVEREPKLVDFAKEHLPSNVEVVQSEIIDFLRKQAAEGQKADFIFVDLDKTMYQPCYEIIMKEGLLTPGGMMLFDNVLYRGLVAQHQEGNMASVSEPTAKNAAALDSFFAKGARRPRGRTSQHIDDASP
jgi:3-dehydroquinate synthase